MIDYSFLQGQVALFANLTSQPQLPSHNPDPSYVTVRTQFLCRIITGAMQTIQKVESDESGQDDQVFVLLIVKGVLYLECSHFWVESVQRNHTYAIIVPHLEGLKFLEWLFLVLHNLRKCIGLQTVEGEQLWFSHSTQCCKQLQFSSRL